MQKLAAIILLSFVSCCAQQEQRLPEPTGTAKPPPQWIDYCRREGQEDPSCQQFLKTI